MQVPNLYIPTLTTIKNIVSENKVNDIKTLELEFKKEEDYNKFNYIPGQFAEISLIGKGEAPIGVASSPTEEGSIKFTIKISQLQYWRCCRRKRSFWKRMAY